MSRKKKPDKKKKAPAARPVASPPGGTGLKYIPIDDFFLIPPYLVKQIEGRDYEVGRLYELAGGIRDVPGNTLGVWVDGQHVIKGFMWAGLNPLTMRLVVYALSVDPAYQGRGIVGEAKRILDKIVAEYGLRGLSFSTTKPEIFKGIGAVANGLVYMEA